MGYESRIIFIEGPLRNEDGEPTTISRIGDQVPTVYGNVIVDVDLSKCGIGPVGALIQAAIAEEKERIAEDPDTYAFGFYEDGNTFVTMDPYGDPVSPMSVERLLDAVESEIRTSRESGEVPYRRFTLLQQICRELVTVPRWSNSIGVTALHYGH